MLYFIFCFQAEDGIRYLVRSRGLGDVYKRQLLREARAVNLIRHPNVIDIFAVGQLPGSGIYLVLSLIHI